MCIHNNFRGQCEDDSDWSAQCEAPQDTESQSSHTLEVPKHCHTLSESSCCSNDTLFNLEELNFAAGEVEKRLEQSPLMDKKRSVKKEFNTEFVHNSHSNLPTDLNTTYDIIDEVKKLNPKLLTNDIVANILSDQVDVDQEIVHPNENIENKDVPIKTGSDIIHIDEITFDSEIKTNLGDQNPKPEDKESFNENFDENNYDSVNIDYSQYVDMENAKNSLEFDDTKRDADYIDIIEKKSTSEEDNVYGILADIRFSGPTDSQLMSTSFSESNTCDEKEWDSGSDSRSSSSGEFIWKVSMHNIFYMCIF